LIQTARESKIALLAEKKEAAKTGKNRKSLKQTIAIL
jgi:hypothetical protein